MAPRVSEGSLLSVDWDPHPAIVAGQFFAARGAFRSGFRRDLESVVRGTVIPSIENNFESEGIPPWTPLADATVEKRMAKGTGLKILDETGLLKSVATSTQPWQYNDNEAFLMGSNLGDAFYGVYHEFGTRFMPQRSWATISPQTEDRIEEVLASTSIGKILRYVTVATVVGGSVTAILGAAFGGLLGGIQRLASGR
jgi:phage gpG-like protein